MSENAMDNLNMLWFHDRTFWEDVSRIDDGSETKLLYLTVAKRKRETQ